MACLVIKGLNRSLCLSFLKNSLRLKFRTEFVRQLNIFLIYVIGGIISFYPYFVIDLYLSKIKLYKSKLQHKMAYLKKIV